MLNLVIVMMLSYLAGSFPTSLILGRLFKNGMDIREHGSGNMGATNSFRVLGWKIGLAVAFIDVFKGFAAAHWITNISVSDSSFSEPVIFMFSTLAVVLGHVFPVFSGFRGGKGFGAAVGAVTSYVPLAAPFCLLVFFITLGFTGYVSVCALTASAALPILYVLITLIQGKILEPVILVFFIFIFLLVAFSVRKRLKLYLKGEAEVFEKARIFRSNRR
ncbi:glycerol-3-phosphate acyltransferase [Oceanispirochaeta sp.]|jgi:glycerol-3-phosphate acyltransferase PlsY|uniref:glycerol-3-phosphate acyltransferase n=1 Tax=Oceanispirochaeta sp. TaxID=2035350 RepID=UPI00261A0729|nr:glycerol-3-phosphate acyltransferase [Oceanispirochaeta sp.]MDA3958179.1 glycerol-3-phosphate acyltransferase [Oceanispirochaeta sp.]